MEVAGFPTRPTYMTNQDHEQPDHEQHHHGHEADQGIKGVLRYLRHAPKMWRSDVNAAVIGLVDPKRGERVLDIGAGMGAGVVAALKTGANVIAVEPTPFMRSVLSVRALAQRGRKRLKVVDGAAEHLPVPTSNIDAVWAVNTMHHWIDQAEGAAEIARVLRPGGRFVLVDELFTDPRHPEYESFGARHEGNDHGFTMVDAQEMQLLFEAAGLTDVVAKEELLAARPAVIVSGRAGSDQAL